MKLRQKLAVALATAMVVTSVPVVTMAASTARITKTVTVTNGTELNEHTAPSLEIELDDAFATGAQFYLTLEGAEFNMDPNVGIKTSTPGISVTAVSKTQAIVKNVTDDSAITGSINVSLEGVTVTGEAKISIDGNETEVTSAGPFVFANASAKNATVSVKENTATSFYATSGSTVGTIVISEEVIESLKTTDNKILIDMEHSDFEFTNSTVTLVGTKGFSGTTRSYSISPEINTNNRTIELDLNGFVSTAQTGKGEIEIQGIRVRSTDRQPEVGELNVTVSAKDQAKVETKEVTVATVTEYGTAFTVKETADAVAGKTVDVELTYTELTPDSVAASDIDFVLNQGTFVESTIKAIPAKFSPAPIRDRDGNIIGFTVRTLGLPSIEKVLDGQKLTIETSLGMTGDIVIEATGRYVEAQEVIAATVAEAFEVESESMVLKVGQTKQVGGEIVITETKAGDLKRGTILTVDLESIEGVAITAAPEVKTTGGMEVAVTQSKTTSGQFNIEVTKAARGEVGTITIEGIEVSVNRTTPEGKFDANITVGGSNAFKGAIVLKDFIIVGTPNTEDLASNGLARGTSSFVIGESKYTVNGTVKEMDGASYIQNPGFTMVPVRYVAEAFGVSGRDILFSNGQATIFAGSRTIQLTNNSDVAVVNGVQIKMATKVVIKDGRTYAPIGEVAQLLGIDKAWDSTTKTATFINQ